MKIYIASSWKNVHAVEMLTDFLRAGRHEVFSFVENNYALGYEPSAPPAFENWIKSDDAKRCFEFDTKAATTCDLVVYLGPSGKDAAAEVGAAFGAGVPIVGLWARGEDFGLMRKMFHRWFDRYSKLLVYLAEVELLKLEGKKWIA